MKKRVIALSVSLLLIFGLFSGCKKPKAGLSQVVIGTMSVIETATRGEYSYDMLSSGVSEMPLVSQDTLGHFYPLLASYETKDGKTFTQTCTLSDISSKMSGEYKMVNSVTINAGHTVTLGEGVTIDLVSETTYVKEPPSEPKYVYNPELKVGTEKTTVSARTGYTVETYKVWYKNGQEIKREKLHTSHYKMYQKTIEYNDGFGGLR